MEVKAEVVFNIDKGIGLFEVDGHGHVRKHKHADTFSIFKYKEQIEGQPPAFLQCGGFIYPLIPGRSPILKSGERMYMFPNLENEDGTSVGVCLDNASEVELAQLDQMLQKLAQLKTSEEVIKDQEGVSAEKEEPTWGSTVAGSIEKGVNWLSAKIAQATEAADNFIVKGATKLRDHIKPNEKPAEISPAVLKGVVYTNKASEGVVGVSDSLMTSLAKLTVKAGKSVVGTSEDSEAKHANRPQVNSHAKEAWKVTKSGLLGAAEVFTDLAKGAVAVVQSTGKEASRTVGHKYGSEAEMVADKSLSAAGNTAMFLYNYGSWTSLGITLIEKLGEE